MKIIKLLLVMSVFCIKVYGVCCDPTDKDKTLKESTYKVCPYQCKKLLCNVTGEEHGKYGLVDSKGNVITYNDNDPCPNCGHKSCIDYVKDGKHTYEHSCSCTPGYQTCDQLPEVYSTFPYQSLSTKDVNCNY